MITFFVAVLVLLALGVAIVMYKKLQEAKAQNAKLQSLNQSVRQIQERHIQLVQQLTARELIDQEGRKKLIALGNNYFVFQPINEINVGHFVEMTDLLSDTINNELENPDSDEEHFTELLAILVSKIPDSPRDFSAGFYLNFVPGLLYEFSQAINPTESEDIEKSEEPQDLQEEESDIDSSSQSVSNEH